MTKDELKAVLGQPNGAQMLLPQAEAVFDTAYELFFEGDRAACAFLCRCAKSQSFARRIGERLSQNREPLYAVLRSEDAKTRKNAARLCALVGGDEDVPALSEALLSETQRFVRPSYLLALGAIATGGAEAVLRAYTVTPAATEPEKKHVAAENEALRLALSKFAKVDKHSFTALPHPYVLELRCPKGLAQSTVQELAELGFATEAVFSDAVRVHTAEFAKLFQARSFSEALFCVADRCLATPREVAHRTAKFLRELLLSSHRGGGVFGYRTELRGQADRGAFARELAALMDDATLLNAPSGYEAEVRVELHTNGLANVYVKLFTLPDDRFAYRTASLPASIQPSVAAAVLRHVREHFKANARVLDPCCGSGTLLFEREKLSPCAALTGVDIAHRAVEIARANSAKGESGAKFVINDAQRFEAHSPYDEIISNLPFGNRVGSHDNNERLYFALLNRLPQWLDRDGVAVFYTMEFSLMRRLIRQNPRLRLVSEAKTQAGGLQPGIFVIKLN